MQSARLLAPFVLVRGNLAAVLAAPCHLLGAVVDAVLHRFDAVHFVMVRALLVQREATAAAAAVLAAASAMLEVFSSAWRHSRHSRRRRGLRRLGRRRPQGTAGTHLAAHEAHCSRQEVQVPFMAEYGGA